MGSMTFDLTHGSMLPQFKVTMTQNFQKASLVKKSKTEKKSRQIYDNDVVPYAFITTKNNIAFIFLK